MWKRTTLGKCKSTAPAALLALVLLPACATVHTSEDPRWSGEELYSSRTSPQAEQVPTHCGRSCCRPDCPTFPDGFTAMNATGRYRDATGEREKEPARVVIISDAQQSAEDSVKVSRIVEFYKTKSSHESVLRVRSKTAARFQ